MKKLMVAALMVFTGFTAASADDQADIKKAVFDYFHGQGEASIERLNRAFAADTVSMVGITRDQEGKTQVRAWKNMPEVLARWASNENPAGGARDGEIINLNIIDGRLATVAFRYTDRFYDALTLAKIEGTWKIVAKVYIEQ